MRELIWKFRFALHMRRRAAVPLREGFGMAGSWIEDLDGLNTQPSDAADEELLNWSE